MKHNEQIHYMAKDGERLDQIIARHYAIDSSELNYALNIVYNANPNLAAIKQPYENNPIILLPTIKPQIVKKVVSLWE